MNHLRDAILKCLAGAQKELDEAPVSGLSLVLIGADNTVRYGSVAQDYVDLTSKMLLCAWATLRAINPDLTPSGFSQAAFAIATQAEPPFHIPAFDAASPDPQPVRKVELFTIEGHSADRVN